MNCPKCNEKTTVTDVVLIHTLNEQYRRRKCVACGHVIYTTEFEVKYTDDYATLWNKNHRAAVRYASERRSKKC